MNVESQTVDNAIDGSVKQPSPFNPSSALRAGLEPSTGSSKRLGDLYTLLDTHFAHEPHWWPVVADNPAFEMLVGSVLVQQTRWQTVEAAIRRLLAAGLLTPQALAAADAAEVAAIIRPCAFHTQKAPGLIAICRELCAEYGGDMRAMLTGEREAVRARLLALPRVGRETADTIMLYAGDHALFVVDAYARRLFARVDLFPGFDVARAPYDALQARVEQAVVAWAAAHSGIDLLHHYRWFHALIVEACIHHCQATRPRCGSAGLRPRYVDPRKCAEHCIECGGCPAREMCAYHVRAQDRCHT